jgi:hypothetical protein
MKRKDAYQILLDAPYGRVKYRGSGFGDELRAFLCRTHIIEMRDGWMVVTPSGTITLRYLLKD